MPFLFLFFLFLCELLFDYIVIALCTGFLQLIMIVSITSMLSSISKIMHIYLLLQLYTHVIYTYLFTIINNIFPLMNLRDNDYVEMLFQQKPNDTSVPLLHTPMTTLKTETS